MSGLRVCEKRGVGILHLEQGVACELVVRVIPLSFPMLIWEGCYAEVLLLPVLVSSCFYRVGMHDCPGPDYTCLHRILETSL